MRRRLFSGTRACALAVVIALVFFAAPIHAVFAKVVDRIVAVVNDEIILQSELQDKMKPYEDKIEAMGYSQEREKQMREKLRKEILDKLIDERLTDQQVKSKGISISEDEIDKTIERIKEIRSLTDEQLRQGLKQQGITMEHYRSQLREQLLRSKLLDYEVKSKIVVTDEDIRKYYEDHPGQFGGETRYHLRTIIMRVPSLATDERKAAVRKRMQSVWEKLRNGAVFAEMARRYSESSLAADGGDLGFFSLKELAPEFQKVLKDKKPGTFTQVLDTAQGFQIFYIQEVEKKPPKALDEVRAEIQNRLYQQRVNEGFSQWLQKLRDRSHIKVIQ